MLNRSVATARNWIGSGLRNDDDIAGFQQNILVRVLSLHDLTIVEPERRVLGTVIANHRHLRCLGILLETARQVENAVHIYAATTMARQALGVRRAASQESELQSRVEAARAELGERAFDKAWSTGRSWSRNDAIEHALTFTLSPVVTA